MQTLCVLIIRAQMPYNAPARLATLTRMSVQLSSVQVTHSNKEPHRSTGSSSYDLITECLVDACDVKNGGCDVNAACSHQNGSYAVVCTCKTGYTNTGSASTVNCTGKDHLIHSKTDLPVCGPVSDSCLVKNGGCDLNANCLHEGETFAVKCVCKTGFTNTGTDGSVTCKGTPMISIAQCLSYLSLSLSLCRHLLDRQWWLRFQLRMYA